MLINSIQFLSKVNNSNKIQKNNSTNFGSDRWKNLKKRLVDGDCYKDRIQDLTEYIKSGKEESREIEKKIKKKIKCN